MDPGRGGAPPSIFFILMCVYPHPIPTKTTRSLLYPSLIPHPSSLIPHPSSLIPHPSGAHRCRPRGHAPLPRTSLPSVRRGRSPGNRPAPSAPCPLPPSASSRVGTRCLGQRPADDGARLPPHAPAHASGTGLLRGCAIGRDDPFAPLGPHRLQRVTPENSRPCDHVLCVYVRVRAGVEEADVDVGWPGVRITRGRGGGDGGHRGRKACAIRTGHCRGGIHPFVSADQQTQHAPPPRVQRECVPSVAQLENASCMPRSKKQ